MSVEDGYSSNLWKTVSHPATLHEQSTPLPVLLPLFRSMDLPLIVLFDTLIELLQLIKPATSSVEFDFFHKPSLSLEEPTSLQLLGDFLQVARDFFPASSKQSPFLSHRHLIRGKTRNHQSLPMCWRNLFVLPVKCHK